ncbi:hypothetical protein ES288_A01G167400v1 [Gossypium darwinii]|uniref:STAS domain-containing protein n=1 Tax=Gossypium darwinii TaxID=34276 RepID=A0A5D2HM29_GOSDA|nr:hypothetical protein ES288_A01G167400v1 [Gossypium darwinii]
MEYSNSSNTEQPQTCLEITMEVHRVVPPPHQSTIHKLKTTLKETFFPDDPLRQFKGQPTGKKWILAAQYIFPILQWGPHYSLSLFKSDIVAGLTIASLAIPQGISYAKLANLPPIVGLYSSFVPPLVYAVLGSSRDLAVGPVSIASLILGSMLRQEVSPVSDPVLFLQLAFTTTFFAGLFQASLGFLRLGFIVDFLSKATLIGFMAGAAIIVSLQQLKSLLGITHFTTKMGLVPVLSSVFHNTKEWSWQTILMGFCFLVFLLVARHVEGIAVGRTFAALKNYKVDGNKEMMAIGLMNMVGSSTSCYITTGAFSRSAVNHNAGAKSAVSNIVMSITVMVTLLFLMPLFQYTPNVVLGAIIVSAVVGLIDIPAACQIWKIDKFDFIVMLCAFFGVIFISVQDGLAMAVGMSIFKILQQITRPKTVMLGNIPGTDIFRDLHHYKESMKIPGFLILSIEAPINFANSTYLNERILRWIEEYEAEDHKKQSNLQFVVLVMSAVSTIDTSGVSIFKELKKTVEKKGAELVLVNPLGEVMEKLQKSDEAGDFMRPDCLFLTVGEAVATLTATIKSQVSNHVV